MKAELKRLSLSELSPALPTLDKTQAQRDGLGFN